MTEQLKELILDLLVEDDHWLWELRLEINRRMELQLGDTSRSQVAEIIQGMIDDGLVNLYRGNRFKGELAPIPRAQAMPVLVTEDSWEVPVRGGEEFHIGITSKGRAYFFSHYVN